MSAYATPRAYIARWGEVADVKQLRRLLSDASAMVTAMSAADTTSEEFATLARAVVCAMVHRAIGTAAPGLGVTAQTQSANGFSESLSFSDAATSLYFTATEKKLLKIDQMRAGYLEPSAAAAGEYA